SVVMGLFVYLIWTLNFGYSAFGGALALACLMLPVVIGATEQMLKLVPPQLREAAYALGTTKSRTIMTVVLPAALPGIVSGALLAVARAAGETAPLLFAVGAATAYNLNLFSEANTALSVQIFANANSSFPAAQERAWAAALTLVLLTFIVTLIARVFTARLAHKGKWCPRKPGGSAPPSSSNPPRKNPSNASLSSARCPLRCPTRRSCSIARTSRSTTARSARCAA